MNDSVCIKKRNTSNKVIKAIKRDKYLYIIFMPVFAYFIIFKYIPMYGLQIAFKDFNLYRGIAESQWIGFEYFKQFINSIYFYRLIRNTLLINIYSLLFEFPAPIILALLFNELKDRRFKKVVQTASYLPHFISTVVVVGMLNSFLSPSSGIVNKIITISGGETIHFMQKAEWFRPLYVGSGIWQSIGWNSIIYLSAISGINPELYEAALIDGANRWQKIRFVTIPGILPTIVILFIMRIGSMMNVGFEKVFLMYNSMTYETADVISTYVYRRGMLDGDYGFSTAVGLFNSLINFGLLLFANKISRKLGETSLW